MCDYSGTSEPLIKGNIGSQGDKIYHVPGSPYYERTVIDESQGERWFCTEEEALAAGWRAPIRAASTATPEPMPAPAPTATRAPIPTATATPSPSPTPAPGRSDVRIACIFFDGLVKTTESDEYVEIVNLGDAAQGLAGWTLEDIAGGTPVFPFPSWTLEPGDVFRVYTNEVHPQWGGFSFGRGSPIWSNSQPDTAGLFDLEGELVSVRSYPPGCE